VILIRKIDVSEKMTTNRFGVGIIKVNNTFEDGLVENPPGLY
jgi:hypothetical protein